MRSRVGPVAILLCTVVLTLPQAAGVVYAQPVTQQAGAAETAQPSATGPAAGAQNAADALLDQGQSELSQRLKSSRQQAQHDFDNSEREYQQSSNTIDAVRNQALVGTVLPGLVAGSTKGGSVTIVPAPVAQSSGAWLPTNVPSGPISIIFRHAPNVPAGSAHVVSMPPGIDCPPACSAAFGPGVQVVIQATADPSSVLENVECYAWTAGPTTRRLPGNTLECGWPALVASRGGQTVVYVNGVQAGLQTGSALGNAPGLGGEAVTTGGAGTNAGLGGAGSYGSGAGGGTQPPSGTSSGASSGTAGSAGTCTDMTRYVGYKVVVAPDGFVVGWLTNNSNQTLYVQYTFARGGKPDAPDTGGTVIGPGQTVGGEGGGVWSADADTRPPQIYWTAVLQSDEAQGKQCPAPW